MSDLHERFRSLDNVAFPAGLSPRSGPTRPLETPLSGVRRIGIVVLALAIAAVAFGFSVAALRRSHNEVPASQGSTPPAASPASPVRAQVTNMLRFDGYVCCGAYGDGSLWLSVSNADGSFGGHLVRIDADTGKTADDIPVPGVPTWEVGGGGLSVGDGSVWIATSATGEGTLNSPGGGSDALLVRVDTSTDEVVDQVNLGGLHGDDVVVDDTGVWVLIDGAGNQMHVIRIDPTNDQIVADIPLDSTYAHFILSAGGRVLVLGNRGDPRNLAEPISWVHVIDPFSNTVVDSVSLGDYARLDEAPDGTVLWGLGTHGAIAFDPSTGSVTSISDSAGTGDAVAAGEGRLWYFGLDRAEVQGVDMATGSVDVQVRLPEGATPIALITSPGAVWVMDYSEKVYRIALSPTRSVALERSPGCRFRRKAISDVL